MFNKLKKRLTGHGGSTSRNANDHVATESNDRSDIRTDAFEVIGEGNAPVTTHHNGNNLYEERHVVLSGDGAKIQKGDAPLSNESVHPNRDILNKFTEENPDPNMTKGKSNAALPLVNPPQQQAVYSAEVVMQPQGISAYDMVKGVDQIKLEVKSGNENIPVSPNTKIHTEPQPAVKDRRQVKNRAGGDGFKVCDMNRLKRFIVLGTENNTYYSTPNMPPALSKDMQNTLDNIQCLKNLLDQGRYKEVIDTITKYSVEGRVANEDPILAILALCANYKSLDVQKAAYSRLNEICSIPTKLFKFLDLNQAFIDQCRKGNNPPKPQKFKNERKRKRDLVKNMEISPIENSDNPNTEPAKKKAKEEPVFKTVNKTAKKSSGWGRMRRKCVSKFYEDEKKDACRLLYLMTKYKNRNNWSHKEVIPFCHPKMVGESKTAKDLAIKYCTKGYKKVEDDLEKLSTNVVEKDISEVVAYIKVLEQVNKLAPSNEGDEEKLLEILQQHGYGKRNPREENDGFGTAMFHAGDAGGKKSPIHIVREHLHTGFLNSLKVWEALLVDMPMTALIRNLGKMSSMGLFGNQNNVDTVLNSLANVEKLRIARIHPMRILIAMKVYEQGKGEKSDLTWPVNKQIVNALDKAFYKCFKTPELKRNYKTNLKYMLCLDVSGSMTFHGCIGCEFITPAVASVAMAWVTWNVEDDVELVAFGRDLVDMKERGFTKKMLITEVMKQTRKINFGGTDCSLPMVHALNEKKEIDVFVVYTDSDTQPGRVRPVDALRNYNKAMNRSAKLIVCGMESTGFTIADPLDPNMMDVVGFDSSVPELISEFAKGSLSGACSENCPDCN